jgi:hypothetical protein
VAYLSDSSAQSDVEPLMLAALSAELGVDLAPRRLTLRGGAHCDVDGVAPDESVLVEVFAHQGELKGGQRGKIARDALKLMTLGHHRPGARLILALADPAVVRPLTATSWLAESLKTFGVEVMLVKLDAETRGKIADAQVRQVMVNPAAAATRTE